MNSDFGADIFDDDDQPPAPPPPRRTDSTRQQKVESVTLRRRARPAPAPEDLAEVSFAEPEPEREPEPAAPPDRGGNGERTRREAEGGATRRSDRSRRPSRRRTRRQAEEAEGPEETHPREPRTHARGRARAGHDTPERRRADDAREIGTEAAPSPSEHARARRTPEEASAEAEAPAPPRAGDTDTCPPGATRSRRRRRRRRGERAEENDRGHGRELLPDERAAVEGAVDERTPREAPEGPGELERVPRSTELAQRVAVLVDVAALTDEARRLGGEISFSRLLRRVTGRRALIRALAFVSNREETLAGTLAAQGFDIETVSDEGGTAVAMAVEAMAIAHHVDCVVLAPDVPAMDHLTRSLRGLGLRVETAGFDDRAEGRPWAPHHRLGRDCMFVP